LGRDVGTIKVFLPLPPDCLRPNARPHWARKAAATQKARGDACIATIAAGSRGFTWKAPTLQPTFFFATNRKRDSDNLRGWLKATQDGIADALRVNDKIIAMLDPVEEIDKADPRLEITITELDTPAETKEAEAAT
jgi:crossover junction endodeoxyribonuclease RusA